MGDRGELESSGCYPQNKMISENRRDPKKKDKRKGCWDEIREAGLMVAESN